ncbi:MAG: hypothetical protein KDB54_12575 [Solirubrobacterales bacterium]|nr:hypothetical protein [Solirubrobacterales bacterium]MCB0861477.1 hypothetical protein [Solirubrobacterales bacterium]
MASKRIPGLIATILAAGALSISLAACGSDDDGGTSGTSGSDVATKSTGKDGQVTPDENAPASAKDKDPNAPDKGISLRPGGPGRPASP